MENTIRVQFYFMDGGVFTKSHIQDINLEAYQTTFRPDYKGPKLIALTADDWYGKKLPDTLPPDFKKLHKTFFRSNKIVVQRAAEEEEDFLKPHINDFLGTLQNG